MSTAIGVIQNLSAKGMRVAIVAARFNEDITSKLLEGAQRVLKERNAKLVDVVWVPGAFEIPLMAQHLSQGKKKKYDAIITLACVIRGDTSHFDYVCEGVTRGVMDVSLKKNLPVIFGVLTTENHDQAVARVGGAHGHKGEEAALTAIEMVHLLRK